jgi:hypothetical protein
LMGCFLLLFFRLFNKSEARVEHCVFIMDCYSVGRSFFGSLEELIDQKQYIYNLNVLPLCQQQVLKLQLAYL